uniref:Mediator of RNA polymerase II transcription subunit 19 n=1 Tax=Plectus sambesii TaxID=2011161 RepID=A0A914W2R7_9BILA
MDSPGPSTAPVGSGQSTGALRTKINLRLGQVGTPTLVCPFYLMQRDLPSSSGLLGSMNLLSHYGLDSTYNRFCGPKKLKEQLSAFLPHLPGNIDTPMAQDISSLKMLVEKPPITGKEIAPLSSTALSGFRLNPGPVPDQFRLFGSAETDADRKWKKQKREEDKEKKRKKKKKKRKLSPAPHGTS